MFSYNISTSFRIINLNKLANNALILKNRTKDFYAVVKSDAYGHGIEECSATLYECGINHFAVANVYEGISIRKKLGFGPEILVLGYTSPLEFQFLSRYNLIQSVFSTDYAIIVNNHFEKFDIHIKIESGMNRTGIYGYEIENIIKNMPKVKESIKGIYTHFPVWNDQNTYVYKKFQDFKEICKLAEILCKRSLIKHCASSNIALNDNETYLDYPRFGISLYGINQDEKNLGLSNVMNFYGHIIEKHMVKKDEYVGYGLEYKCKEDTVIATVDTGYNDGLIRLISSGFLPTIRENKVPFAGNICMDRCMLNVTSVAEKGENINVGDIVTFIGNEQDILNMAFYARTIPYEILTTVGKSGNRIYNRS